MELLFCVAAVCGLFGLTIGIALGIAYQGSKSNIDLLWDGMILVREDVSNILVTTEHIKRKISALK